MVYDGAELLSHSVNVEDLFHFSLLYFDVVNTSEFWTIDGAK